MKNIFPKRGEEKNFSISHKKTFPYFVTLTKVFPLS